MARANDPQRKTVPRWREWRIAVLLNGSPTDSDGHTDHAPLAESERAWQQNRSVGFAADFVAACYCHAQRERGREAAEFLVSSGCQVPRPAVEMAHALLREGPIKLGPPERLDVFSRRPIIRELKRKLVSSPRNALALVDLAREYVLQGQRQKARSSLTLALAISPRSRLVIRSAARFFLFLGDPERAHSILVRNANTRADPWLLAAEIAIADAMGKTSRLVAGAKRIVGSGNFSPRSISELASALATLEWGNGSRRRARHHFLQAMDDPTENSVAQAAFISRRQKGVVSIPERARCLPRSYEASAWAALQDGRWTDAAEQSESWFADEPFSSRSAVFSSWVASALLGRHEDAIRLTAIARRISPDSFMLDNNLAFSLASIGRWKKARKILEVYATSPPDDDDRPVLNATRGLIAYRSGDIKSGRDLYGAAIRQAVERNDFVTAITALGYVGREEQRIGQPNAADLFDHATDLVSKIDGWEARRCERILEVAGSCGEAEMSSVSVDPIDVGGLATSRIL